jgi:fibronectin type III domain protein
MKTFKKSLVSSVVLAVSVATGRLARADMGAAWVDEVTRHSVTLNWSDPQGSNRLASAIPLYRVSWAPVDAEESVLLANATVLVGASSKPHVISGLEAGAYYQFRVEAHATWIDGSGDPLNPKYRQVATIRQRTATTAPGPSLRLAGAGEKSLHVEFTTPTPEAFDVIRIAYKERWNLEELNSTARDPLGPQTRWVTCNASCGWVDVASGPDLREALPPYRPGFPIELSKDTSYEIVAYGFNIGDVEGTLLGNVLGKTSGGRRFPRLSEAVARDHADIFLRYARLPRQPNVSIIDFVAEGHPEIYGVRDLLIADHQDDLSNDFTALQFLSAQMPEMLQGGGGGEASVPVLDIGTFVEAEYPDLFTALQVELGPAVFQRGDASPNGMIDISDPIRILAFLFDGRVTEVSCLDAADANDSGQVDLSDSVFIFNFLFGTGPEIPSPHDGCGVDSTPDGLDCEFYEDCPR